MVLTEEEKRNWKILAIGLIMVGISIQAYIMWSEGQKTEVNRIITQTALSTMRGG